MNLAKKIVVLTEFFRKRSIVDVFDESDDDEEEILHSLIAQECDLRLGRSRGNAPPRQKNYVEAIVPAYTAGNFRSHFRVAPAAANDLENRISSELWRQGPMGRSTISPRKQLLAVLWLLATPDSYRSVGEQFDLSKSTLHDCFRRVTRALCNISNDQIQWPQGVEAQSVKQAFSRAAGLDNVLGAIDGCHVEIDAPKENPEAYRTGKKKYAITLQAVCVPNLLFTDIFAGFPGAAHDSRIMKNSPLFRDSEHIFSGDDYLVGDKAYYPVRTWCIPPYKNNGNLSEAELHFNRCHSKTRQVIERAFALLKGRFRRLKHLVMYRTDEIPQTMLATCVMHNVCLRGLYDTNDELEDYIREGTNTEANEPDDDTVDDFNLTERSNQVALRKRDIIKNQLYIRFSNENNMI